MTEILSAGRIIRLQEGKNPYHLKKGLSKIRQYIASDSEAPVLDISGVWNISSLLLLTGPLWPGMVIPIMVLSASLIDLFKRYSYSIRLCAKNNNKRLFNNNTKKKQT